MKNYVDKNALQEFATKMNEKQKTIFATKSQVGSPLVASLVADMTDTEKVYVYVGSETGYTAGNWYYYDGSDWTSGGVYNAVAIQTDDTLSIEGMAADAKAVGDALAGGDALTDDVKQALLQFASKVAYIDADGQDYYDALEAALYPDATLVSISAVYTQSGTVFDTDSLDSLKTDLIVTAHFSDSSTAIVSGYTLSGILTAGTSTITVTYGGKTATFNVTVTHAIVGWLYHFNDSLLSSGTKDFGFTGAEKYVTGVDGKAYYHESTDGEASTDQYGIKAVNLTDLPDLSGDWTLSLWYKSVTNKRGHLFAATKYFDSGESTNLPTPSNVKSGWTVSKGTTGMSKAAGGIVIDWESQILKVKVINTAGTYGAVWYVTPPSSFDSSEWHHYALTQDRTSGYIYFFIDGEIIFTVQTNTTVYFGKNVAIGNLFGNTSATQTELQSASYGDIVDDLYIAEICKWTTNFDPSAITY